MKRIYLYACVLSALLMASCGKKMPKDVIPTDRMERILYDYHLATAVEQTASHVDNVEREALRRSVFAKYGITEAQFDSSMVWYSRHPEELAKIYTNLQTQLQGESEHVSQLLASREEGMTLSVPGDTVDMWHGDAYYRLEARNPLNHLLTFSMAADSNFQANDAIRWTARYAFAPEAKAVLRMGLSVIYDNDSVAGEVKNVTRSGEKSIYIPQDSAYKIKTIHGFIVVPANAPRATEVLVHDMELMRYHVPFDSTRLQRLAQADSLAADSAKSVRKGTDTVTTVPNVAPLSVDETPQRLSPDQLKRQPGAVKKHSGSTNNRSGSMNNRPGSTNNRPGSTNNRPRTKNN